MKKGLSVCAGLVALAVVGGGAALVLLGEPRAETAALALVDLGSPSRPLPGLEYAPSKTMPKALAEEYTRLADDLDRARERNPENDVYRKGFSLPWLDPNNRFAQGLGLRASDKVLSVHGQPAGKPISLNEEAIRRLEQDKGFAVLVERDGKQLVLSYRVP